MTEPLGVRSDLQEQLARHMKRPEGTIKLGKMRPTERSAAVHLQVVAGSHVFRIHRDAEGGYTAIHGCPGIGTLVAKVEPKVTGEVYPDVWVAWSPESLHLYLVDPANPSQIVTAEGTASNLRLWVDINGAVTEVGGGIEGLSVWAGGQPTLGPPAIDLWDLTLFAVNTLMEGRSEAGYMFDVAVANSALGMLVTGLESYSQARFVELEGEGIPLNAEAVIRKLGTREEREQLRAGIVPGVIADAADEAAVANALAERFSFQGYEKGNTLFGQGYGLRYGVQLDLDPPALKRIKVLLGYRHRIAHVSPLVVMLNSRDVPPEEPEFTGRAFAERARREIDCFVRSLHAASLRLRPPQTRGS